MKTLLLFLSLAISAISFSQLNLKKIKKEIPIKGIKEMSIVEGTENLIFYRSKKEDGIWDNNKKKIIAKGIKETEILALNKEWIRIDIGSVHKLYDHINSRELLVSRNKFEFQKSQRDNLLLVTAPSLIGIYHKDRKELCLHKSTSEDITFYKDSIALSWGEMARTSLTYIAKDQQFYLEEYLGDGVYGGWSANEMDGYIIERSGSGMYNLRISNPNSGTELFSGNGHLFKWSGGYGVNHSREVSYFDKDFNVMIESTNYEKFSVNEFEKIVGNGIIDVKHIVGGLFYLENNNGVFLYSLSSEEQVTKHCDQIFLAGQDVLISGYSAFLYSEGKVGFYHTNGFTLEPKYSSVELRMIQDGSFGYKADNEFYGFKRTGDYGYYAEFNEQKSVWNEDLEFASTIYNHVSVSKNRLIVSLRICDPDTHDSAFGTNTKYEGGSGVYDIQNQRWLLRNYHYITPFQGYYVATKAGSSYKNWLKAEIYDGNFNLLNKDELASPKFYKGKLFVRNKKYDLVEYDIKTQKEIKVIGDSESPYDDYMYYKGYLFMGSANYNPRDEHHYSGFEILSILTPNLELIPHKGMGFYKLLGDGLIVMGKYVEERNYGRDWNGNPKDPEQMAIIDIYTGKKITSRWYREIYEYDDKITLVWVENDERKFEEVPLNKLRDHLKK